MSKIQNNLSYLLKQKICIILCIIIFQIYTCLGIYQFNNLHYLLLLFQNIL